MFPSIISGDTFPLIEVAIRVIKILFNKDDNPPPHRDSEAPRIDETVVAHQHLEAKRQKYTDMCRDFEEQIAETVEQWFNTFLDKLQKLPEVAIQTDVLKIMLRQYTQKINGGLSDRINRRLSLSDSEYAAILREPDATRSERYNQFNKKIIREGYDSFMQDLERLTKDALTHVEAVVKGKLESQKAAMEQHKEGIAAITKELSAEEFAGKKQDYAEKRQALEALLAH
jgi:hypothetical protein